jgi:hypothetical protein
VADDALDAERERDFGGVIGYREGASLISIARVSRSVDINVFWPTAVRSEPPISIDSRLTIFSGVRSGRTSKW